MITGVRSSSDSSTQCLSTEMPSSSGIQISSSTRFGRLFRNCLRACEQGPIAVVYPEGVWYHSAVPEVLDRILEEHVVGGRPVEEYVFARNPLSCADEQETE